MKLQYESSGIHSRAIAAKYANSNLISMELTVFRKGVGVKKW